MSEIPRSEQPEEIQLPPKQFEQSLENQESKVPMAKRVLRDFQKFIERHVADFDSDEFDPNESEIDILTRIFEKPPVDMWTFYIDFYQSNIDNIKYKDDSETRKVMEEYNKSIAELLEACESNPNIEIQPDRDKKWVLSRINGGVEAEHMGRFYLNLKPEEAVKFYKSALEQLMESGVHVGAKIVMQGRIKCFNQRDKAVIYFDSKEETQVLEVLEKLHGDDKGAFDDTGIPAFTAEIKDKDGNIMEGIGFGEDPDEDGKSFGMIRSQILLEIYQELKKLKKKNSEINIPLEKYHELFTKYCKKQFYGYGVDPDSPAFNITRKKHKPFPIIRNMAKES